jgi:predicted permease
MEQQLEKELQFHLEQHIADLIAQGHSREESRRLARLSLGGPEQVKENCRDARGTRWLEDLWYDFHYALRALRQRPGFACVALLTLALGTGATTVIFTVINGVLLKPLPYSAPDRLVTLQGRTATFGDQFFAYPDFKDFETATRKLESVAGYVYQAGAILSEKGEAEYVDVREITSGLFSVLGVPLFRGRAFVPEEDRPQAAPVVILSYGLWQRRFAGNSSVVGRSVVLDDKQFTVTGVAPRDFRLDGVDADVYLPLGQNTASYLQNRRAHPVRVVARLHQGVTVGAANAEVALLGSRLAAQYPATNTGRTFDVQLLRPNVADVRSTLWLLLGAVSLVLLIACANVASLLLARAVSRGRELAMRAALGATRLRLARQCLTESAVLGLAGGLLGIMLAILGLRPFVRFWPGSLPRAEEIQIDWHVLLFALSVSLLSGLLFGLAPALRVPVRALEQMLRAGSRTVAGGSRRLHSSFVVSEIALAIVLLVSAGMLGRTLVRLSSLDPGFDIRNILVTRMALSPSLLSNPTRIRAAWQDVLDRASRMPGVQAIAMVDTVPMRRGFNELGYWTTGTIPPLNQQPLALATSATSQYLKVMGIPLRQGRFFNDQDRRTTQPVIVIDDVLAEHSFPGESPVGKRLWIPDMGAGSFEVVGVVGHVRHWGLASDDKASVRAQFYYPFAQVPDPLLRRWSELMSIAVRTSVPPLNVVESLRRELRGAKGDQVLYDVNTMDQLAGATLDRQRFLLILFGAFAGLALLLACIGIYGVLAYVTSQRVPEIGVRMALGASPGDVVRLVLRQSFGMIATGVAIGMSAAYAATRLLERLVAGMQPTEPLTFFLMILVLVAAALIASFMPARRASRVDPTSALRQE